MPPNNAERDLGSREPAEIVESLREFIQDETIFVGHGQYSPYATHKRVTVLVVNDRDLRPPEIIWDRFFPMSALPALREAIGVHAREVWHGELDTMYGTPWSYAWTTSPGPFRICDRQGVLVESRADVVVLRQEAAPLVIPRVDIVQVVGWLAPDWAKRGVRIELRRGESIGVATNEEAMAILDPTYDGIDLMFDAAWVTSLGNAMAAGLGVPYVAEDSALA
ncbi:MAG TPA: hypothetical protein PK156_02155 [Polyangium sp.]|nr:hypothetical protein [Polyangium sp.]